MERKVHNGCWRDVRVGMTLTTLFIGYVCMGLVCLENSFTAVFPTCGSYKLSTPSSEMIPEAFWEGGVIQMSY